MADEPDTMAIVGASLAGAKAAEALREQGFAGQVVLIGREDHLPYERPPLSKAYLSGSAERDSMIVHPSAWYEEQRIELRLGQPVGGLDRDAHLVHVDGAEPIRYDRLLLATGSSPRRLDVPGADARGVHTLRTIEDSDVLGAALTAGSRLVVIGAGWIGLEVAAVARQAGVEVTVVEAAPAPLLAALGLEAAEVFVRLHRDHGVRFRFDATAEEIRTADGAATGVVLGGSGDGELLPADTVLVAVGATPNVQLAVAAGLEVDNGVRTDAGLRTSDPDIFAVGDIASADHPFYGYPLRVEHWANALNQPAVAAANMLGAADASYDRLPYFFSDQYDLGMEFIGHPGPRAGADEDDLVIFRGDVAGFEFIAFWLRDGRVIAGMPVNTWDMVDPIQELIISRAPVDPARLADPAIDLPAATR